MTKLFLTIKTKDVTSSTRVLELRGQLRWFRVTHDLVARRLWFLLVKLWSLMFWHWWVVLSVGDISVSRQAFKEVWFACSMKWVINKDVQKLWLFFLANALLLQSWHATNADCASLKSHQNVLTSLITGAWTPKMNHKLQLTKILCGF